MGPNPQETVDLVTFTEEILDEKFFVQSVLIQWVPIWEYLSRFIAYPHPLFYLVDYR